MTKDIFTSAQTFHCESNLDLMPIREHMTIGSLISQGESTVPSSILPCTHPTIPTGHSAKPADISLHSPLSCALWWNNPLSSHHADWTGPFFIFPFSANHSFLCIQESLGQALLWCVDCNQFSALMSVSPSVLGWWDITSQPPSFLQCSIQQDTNSVGACWMNHRITIRMSTYWAPAGY